MNMAHFIQIAGVNIFKARDAKRRSQGAWVNFPVRPYLTNTLLFNNILN